MMKICTPALKTLTIHSRKGKTLVTEVWYRGPVTKNSYAFKYFAYGILNPFFSEPHKFPLFKFFFAKV